MNIICAIATFFYFLSKAVISKQAEKGLSVEYVRPLTENACAGDIDVEEVGNVTIIPPGSLHGPIPSSQSHI